MLGYADPAYVASLGGEGAPRALPRSGGWLLCRPIPDSSLSDAVGPYPLLSCPDWHGLADDLDELTEEVSVTAVADPLGDHDESLLRRCFPDLVAPFKRHCVVDLGVPAVRLPEGHRRHVKRAARALEVEVSTDPGRLVAEWVPLYANLVRRHDIAGVAAFGERSLARQLHVAGAVAVRALLGGETVGMAIWYRQGSRVFYHLGAYSDAGYAVGASYAVFAEAIEHFRRMGAAVVDLGGTPGVEDADSGLRRFKQGWSSSERTAHLCGRIVRRRDYARLAARGGSGTWFPVYRAPRTGDATAEATEMLTTTNGAT